MSQVSVFRVFIFVLLLTSQVGIAQDPIFSQYYNSPLVMNPAIAGISDEPNFVLNYRNQWPGFPNAYQTYSASYDQFFEYMNSGIGFLIVSDDAGNGILKTNKISGIYSYRVRIRDDHYIKWGFEAGLIQSRLDWDKLVFLDQLDEELGPISPGGTPIPTTEQQPESDSQIYLDIGVGAMYYNKNYYAGFSMKHLNTPDQSFLNVNSNLYSGLPIRMSAQLGTELKFFGGSRKLAQIIVAPSAIWVRQGPLQQLNVGSMIDFGFFNIGGWYRTSFQNADAIIAGVGFRTGMLKINYSFDYTLSAINLNGGTHEIGIGINFDDGQSESIYNDCFNIFR